LNQDFTKAAYTIFKGVEEPHDDDVQDINLSVVNFNAAKLETHAARNQVNL
jgi:hypothetical protein